MHKKKSKFTLIEMLVVISILALLAAMLYPAYGKHREKAAVVEAKAHMTKIITALSAYKTQYVDYELISSSTTDFEISWTTLKPILMGNDVNRNPRNIQFLTDDIKSPWKNGDDYDGFDYRIKVDANEDGVINFDEGSPSQSSVRRDIIMYMKNPGLKATDDDIRSWE